MSIEQQIELLWKKLGTITDIKSKMDYKYGGLTGNFQGEVKVSVLNTSIITFQETGQWHSIDTTKPALAMQNSYQWQRFPTHISLSHLRFGFEHPVFLLDFVPRENNFSAIEPHHCSEDLYNATLTQDNSAIHLFWEISGPTKSGQINLTYF